MGKRKKVSNVYNRRISRYTQWVECVGGEIYAFLCVL